MTLVDRQSMTNDDGTFTTGTPIDKDFIDGIYGQIDDQNHSASNPTIKPKATTDEVVTARGSKVSLDARLDVVLNEDGTLKTQASLVTQTQVMDALGNLNLCINDTFLIWAAGDTSAPTNWVLSGAGAAIVRAGSGVTEASAPADTERKVGPFCSKITYGSAAAILTQTMMSTAEFSLGDIMKGTKIGFGAWVKASVGSQCRLTIDDGVTTSNTGYHTGDGTWQFLGATHTISGSATKLDFQCRVESSGTGYFSGTVALLSDLAPVRWVPARILSGIHLVFISGAQTVATVKPSSMLGRQTAWIMQQVTLRALTTAPTGADLIVDVNSLYSAAWNSMFTAGGRPKIVAAASVGESTPDGTYRNRCFARHTAAADATSTLCSADVDQIGSGVPGTDLYIEYRYLYYDPPMRQFTGAL